MEALVYASRVELARLAEWLEKQVWPVWLENGVDWKVGAFHEHLNMQYECDSSFRRLRVVARQIYSFSIAAQYGVPRAEDAVMLGVTFLRRHRLSDGGYPWRYNLSGTPTDYTRDLYDHAFTLLAFAKASSVLGPADVVSDARATLSFIRNSLSHQSGGFHESIPDVLPRRQNPHMHLLEAALVAWDAFHEEAYAEIADQLVDLFTRRFFQFQVGALPEYFEESLKPIKNSFGFMVEPGHHYEWAWLLGCYDQLNIKRGLMTEACVHHARKRLLEFADVYGLSNKTGLVVAELSSDGGVKDGTFRLWAQTERIKCEADRADHSFQASSGIAAIWKMIAGAPPGLWNERLSPDGVVIEGPAPASSLYHLSCALEQAKRIMLRFNI